jgi:ZIP family zinc transporter
MLGAAAGIMLAAAAFSLIEPGLAEAAQLVGSRPLGTVLFGLSLAAGGGAILAVHRYVPHEHLFTAGLGPHTSEGLRGVWLLVVALTLHNLPEGMAVGVGSAGGTAGGAALTIGIFIQNMPEGFVPALALVAQGYGRGRAVGIACATGLAETIGGLLGAIAVTLVQTALPWAMGFAAGAMLFVISHEIIPETHRNDAETEATLGLIAGFIVMLVLDSVFA